MKLSDIIESSGPAERIVWAVIRLEFDTILKPAHLIKNRQLRDRCIKKQACSLEWLTGKYITPDKVNGPKYYHGIDYNTPGLTFDQACEIVGVSKSTLMTLFMWAIHHRYPYFPVAIDFKNLKQSDDPEDKEKVKIELQQNIPPQVMINPYVAIRHIVIPKYRIYRVMRITHARSLADDFMLNSRKCPKKITIAVSAQ